MSDGARRFPALYRVSPQLYLALRSIWLRCRLIGMHWFERISAVASKQRSIMRKSFSVLRNCTEAISWFWAAFTLRKRRNRGTDNNHIVMLVVSDLRIDPRVEREARALAAAGFSITVLCPDISRPPLREVPIDWGSSIAFHLLSWEAASFIHHFPWVGGQQMFHAASKYRPMAFHCHDLTTSLMGLAAARHSGAACICDFHEWYSENVSWDAKTLTYIPHPFMKKAIYRLVERLVMRSATEVITVCESISRELSHQFSSGRRTVQVIRNIPPIRGVPIAGSSSLRRDLRIPDDGFLLLWQGGTGPTRLLEPIIEALRLVPNVTFVIRGPSLELFGDGYRSLSKQLGVENQLVLLPPVKSAEVVEAAVGADAGIWTLPNLSKNFYYALPNKIFEYMAAGLPVLAANFPEARKMVEENGIGLCFDPYDPHSIAAQIRRLIYEPGIAERCRSAIPEVLKNIRAEEEWDKLVRIYRKIDARTGTDDSKRQMPERTEATRQENASGAVIEKCIPTQASEHRL